MQILPPQTIKTGTFSTLFPLLGLKIPPKIAALYQFTIPFAAPSFDHALLYLFLKIIKWQNYCIQYIDLQIHCCL